MDFSFISSFLAKIISLRRVMYILLITLALYLLFPSSWIESLSSKSPSGISGGLFVGVILIVVSYVITDLLIWIANNATSSISSRSADKKREKLFDNLTPEEWTIVIGYFESNFPTAAMNHLAPPVASLISKEILIPWYSMVVSGFDSPQEYEINTIYHNYIRKLYAEYLERDGRDRAQKSN